MFCTAGATLSHELINFVPVRSPLRGHSDMVEARRRCERGVPSQKEHSYSIAITMFVLWTESASALDNRWKTEIRHEALKPLDIIDVYDGQDETCHNSG